MGNCILSGIQSVCANGYIQRADGVCILPPAVCDDGYKSDGNGDCVLIAPHTEGPEPVSTEQQQSKNIVNVNTCTCPDECEIISEYIADVAFDKSHGLPTPNLSVLSDTNL